MVKIKFEYPVGQQYEYEVHEVIAEAADTLIMNAASKQTVLGYDKEPAHAKWIHKPHVYGVSFCSACDFENHIDDSNYCPNCGAKMVEPQNSEG